jgi:hypothetical protein
MSTEAPDQPADETQTDEEEARWPAVVGIILIVMFTWGGIEVFALSGKPIATLEHDAITADTGATFDVEEAGESYVVQVWSFRPSGEDEQAKRAEATMAFSVVGPSGDVVAEHRDAKARSDARYVELVAQTAGEYRVRLDRIGGEDEPRAQAVVITGNNQVLLPFFGRFVE